MRLQRVRHDRVTKHTHPKIDCTFSPLCYTVSHQLSVLYIVVYICQSQSPKLSLPFFLTGVHTFVLYICVCFCFANRFICTIFFSRFHMDVLIYSICFSLLTCFTLYDSLSSYTSLQRAISFFFTTEQRSILSVCHVFFIYSCADAHLGCFHALAISNSVGEHWSACIFWNYGFLWLFAQEQDCWVIWQFYSQQGFLGTFTLFSIVAVLIYISTNNVEGFPFLYSLSSGYCLQILDDGHPDQYEAVSHYSFDIHFSNNQ